MLRARVGAGERGGGGAGGGGAMAAGVAQPGSGEVTEAGARPRAAASPDGGAAWPAPGTCCTRPTSDPP